MFFDVLKNACLERNTTPTGLVKKLGLSSSKVTAWGKGSVPNGEILVKIADYLDCSVDYLLERQSSSNNKPDVAVQLPKDVQELIEKYNDLDLTGKGAISKAIDTELERMKVEKNPKRDKKIG